MMRHIVAAIGVIAIIVGAVLWILDILHMLPSGPWGTIIGIIFLALGLIIAFLSWIYQSPTFGGITLSRHTKRNIMITLYTLVVVLFTVASMAAIFLVINTKFDPPIQCGLPRGRGISLPAELANGVGVIQTQDNNSIGLSDGSFAFDTNRKDGELKRQAAQQIKNGQDDAADSLLLSATGMDTNDAEGLIYQEDQRVLHSGHPYITLVIGATFTPGTITGTRDILQGAYISQIEYNRNTQRATDTQLYLLIANSGSNNAQLVACQISQAAHLDKHIVGVMGWPRSADTLTAVGVLAAAHIPMVSPTASSDLLDGISPYFFRAAPSDARQGSIGAQYAVQTLQAAKVVLFVDETNPYSASLARAFSQQFEALARDQGSIVAREAYTVGSPATAISKLNDALSHNPDLIYFAGYASDANPLIEKLPATGSLANLNIMGGDALFLLSGPYPENSHGRLYFTAFGQPDEWNDAQKGSFPFYCDYSRAFDPPTACPGPDTNRRFGYNRADADVMLAYDSVNVLLKGSQNLLDLGKTYFTPDDLQQKLAHLGVFQGVTGSIDLVNGDPVDKEVLILFVDQDGHTLIAEKQGCLQVSSCS